MKCYSSWPPHWLKHCHISLATFWGVDLVAVDLAGVDLVGSWSGGSWPCGSWFHGSWSLTLIEVSIWYTEIQITCIDVKILQVCAVPLSFNVAMANVSPPPFDAMEGQGDAPMEVMRGTAVSLLSILTVTNLFLIKRLVIIFAVSCQSGAFRCNNGTCILSSRRCDGTVDCIDDSDETGCGSKLLKNLEIKYQTILPI